MKVSESDLNALESVLKLAENEVLVTQGREIIHWAPDSMEREKWDESIAELQQAHHLLRVLRGDAL